VLLGDNQELYAEALPYFEESYRINKSIGARVSMGWDQVNRAAALSALGRFDEARAALDEAYAIASESEFRSQLATVNSVRAEMALNQGHRAEATTRATAALKLAERGYPDTALEAKQTLALVAAMSGATEKAIALAAEALTAARELKLPRLISTALLTSADVHLTGEDARAALADAQAAQKLFAGAAQLESEWRAWLVAARAMQLEGNSSMAYDYAVRAEAARAALQARWGDDNYRGYMRRPDIQIHLKQLGRLLGAKKIVQRGGG
jgi:ATP/maltotriose-dependent transcriptional regulator MalT